MGNSQASLLAAVILLTGSLFIVDLMVPLGVAVWLPYLGVVLLSLWFSARWQTFATVTVCTALILVGLVFSPPGQSKFLTAAVNRLLGIFALWTAAFVGLAARRTRQLEEANRKLEDEIVERERLQNQLLRSQRLEAIGVLASGIAHDFNNLLTPILMSVKLLKEARPEEERLHLLSTLQASAERGAEVVRRLLTFAGGTSGQHAVVPVDQIIMEIDVILEHALPKNIRITLAIAEDLKPVQADATQLSQVLMNLCVNARDAMPNGGVLTVQADNVVLDQDQIRLHPDAPAGSYVRIALVDSGVGIDPKVLDRVFDPFFTTKGPNKGTGLGLSTALGIVRSHRGFIDVQSEPGQGSRFAVYIPAYQPGSVSGIAAPVEQKKADHAEAFGITILLVDDESMILETAKANLEQQGYRVLIASSGKLAIDLFCQYQSEIRAVLIDMMMPEIDGQATIDALKRLDPEVRIVASSGLRPNERTAAAIAKGRMHFLPKPYSDEQLLAAVARVLRQNEGER